MKLENRKFKMKMKMKMKMLMLMKNLKNSTRKNNDKSDWFVMKKQL